MIKYSVIVMMHNDEDNIDICLNTLVNQKYKNLEIILVNVNSVDNTSKIVKSYLNKHKNIKYIEDGNISFGKAKNEAIKKATGDYIHIIKAIDYFDFNFYNSINTNNADIIITDYYNTYISWKQKYISIKKYNNKNNIKNSEYFLSGLDSFNKIIKTDLVKNYKFNEELKYENLDFFSNIIKSNPKIIYINECLLYHGDILEKTIFSKFETIKYMYANMKELKSIKKELDYIVIDELLYNLCIILFKQNKVSKINEITDYVHENIPKFKDNPYFKEHNLKYKFICNSFYNKNYKLLKLLVSRKENSNGKD